MADGRLCLADEDLERLLGARYSANNWGYLNLLMMDGSVLEGKKT